MSWGYQQRIENVYHTYEALEFSKSRRMQRVAARHQVELLTALENILEKHEYISNRLQEMEEKRIEKEEGKEKGL